MFNFAAALLQELPYAAISETLLHLAVQQPLIIHQAIEEFPQRPLCRLGKRFRAHKSKHDLLENTRLREHLNSLGCNVFCLFFVLKAHRLRLILAFKQITLQETFPRITIIRVFDERLRQKVAPFRVKVEIIKVVAVRQAC